MSDHTISTRNDFKNNGAMPASTTSLKLLNTSTYFDTSLLPCVFRYEFKFDDGLNTDS